MISVCMATYNGEKYIKEQLVSILEQLSYEDEIIISDDGSSDETINIISSIDDSRIVLVQNQKVHGYTANFYNALSYARGDYIFLSDQDDIWADRKVDVTLNYLKEYDFTVSDAKEVDKNLNTIAESRFAKYKVKSGFWSNLIRGRYLGCCMAFRKNVLSALFPVPSYQNNYPYDIWIALIAEKYFKTSLIHEPLILYRRHGENASNGGDNSGSKRSLTARVCSRFYYIWFVYKQKAKIKKLG